MTDTVVDAEVVQEAGLAKTDGLSNLVKESDKPLLGIMEHTTLDWKSLKPNQMAVLLMQKPMPVSGGGVLYLTFKQALYYAVRCFELDLSPFGGDTWFDSSRFSVNLTLEGRRTIARNRGLDLGPPIFEQVKRNWQDIPRMTQAAEEAKKIGFLHDAGVTCTMRVGPVSNNEKIAFTAYLSEWFVSKSPVWREKPLWMLSVRAQDKCLTMAIGTGVSEAIVE